ncbi:hypothetical protein BGT96224_2337 [Blumeria graminis f. sp. tritici 96224]|uniref:Uncharacterized protein n=1 Tax=Blumeria graminis f. sp. tritici 96224 TaxID=1268274 RepID=A0A656KIJ3_BLUGR|nr:hypothetical protein BGT96224_2337 [Blumeria graminis f. sp. tritici 96224]
MAAFVKRQFVGDDFVIVEREPSFWWTKTGQIVRWSIFFGLSTIFTAYILIGYIHAKSRMKKGLPLLSYHRWLVSDETRMRYDPNYTNPNIFYGYHQNGIGMQPMPQQMYGMNAPLPPTYQPQSGVTKVDSSPYNSQPTHRPETSDPTPNYEAPPGPPPPPTLPPNQTGATATGNPYRL